MQRLQVVERRHFFQAAIGYLRAGKVERRLIRDLDDAHSRITKQLKEAIRDFTSIKYIEGTRFLNGLSDAAEALRDPSVSNHLRIADELEVKVKTLEDLIAYLREHGCQFAPASGSDCAAYVTLCEMMKKHTRPGNPVGDPDASKQRRRGG